MLRLPPGPRSFRFRLGLPRCFRFGGKFLPRFWLHAFRKLCRSCLAIPLLESLIGYFAFEQKLGKFSTLRLAFKRHDIPRSVKTITAAYNDSAVDSPLLRRRLEVHLPLSRPINFLGQEEDGDSRFYRSAGLRRQGDGRHVDVVRQIDDDNKVVIAKSEVKGFEFP